MGTGCMTARIPEGEFPDTDELCAMFGQDFEAVVSMPDKQTIIDIMNEAQGILSDTYRSITMDINGHFIVSSVNPDCGEFSKDISSEVDIYRAEDHNAFSFYNRQLENHIGTLESNLTMAFNPAYIIDACKQIPDTGINLLFPGADKPILIQSEVNGFQAVVMPKKL